MLDIVIKLVYNVGIMFVMMAPGFIMKKCRLAPEGLYYVGTDDGAQVEEFFPILDAYRLLFGAGENFEVYRGREIWYFTPEDTRTCVGWYILSKIYNDAARASSQTV